MKHEHVFFKVFCAEDSVRVLIVDFGALRWAAWPTSQTIPEIKGRSNLCKAEIMHFHRTGTLQICLFLIVVNSLTAHVIQHGSVT